MRVPQMVRFNWRETTRLAFRSVMTLAVLSAASLTQLYAFPFSVTIRSGQGVTYTLGPSCSGSFSSAPFTATHFNSAATGAAASIVTPDPRWIGSLPCDSQARWISTNANRNGHTALFAQPFRLACRPLEGTVTLTFCWAVDDHLGDPPNGAPNMGVFINGVPLPIKGGNYWSQSTVTVSVPTSILHAGVNYLYVYVWEYGCSSPGGVIYSATLRGMCPPVCTLDNEQPWNKCLPSTPSAVIDCAPPTPTNFLVAQCTDDFVATYTGAVNTVEWWGTLSDPSQRFRPFQIAFYPQGPNCQPPHSLPIFRACVVPHAKPVGVDCEGRRVWHFSARLPAPYFQQAQGQKYWLMITEIDSASIRPGQIDFQWSGHAACNNCANGELVCNCRAIKFTVVNGIVVNVNPVVGCSGEITDLAWALRWRTRYHINFSSPLRGAITAQFRIPGGAVVEEHVLQVEPFVDSSNVTRYRAVLDTALPNSDYELVIISNGALPMVHQVSPTGDGPIDIDADPVWGDLNMDGVIDDGDLLTVLFNFGMGG